LRGKAEGAKVAGYLRSPKLAKRRIGEWRFGRPRRRRYSGSVIPAGTSLLIVCMCFVCICFTGSSFSSRCLEDA
jgi:hypothetical protein